MRRGFVLAALLGLTACSGQAHHANSCGPVIAQQQAYEHVISHDRATESAGPTSCDLKCELTDPSGANQASVDEQHQTYLWATMITQNPRCFSPGDRSSAQAYLDAHRH